MWTNNRLGGVAVILCLAVSACSPSNTGVKVTSSSRTVKSEASGKEYFAESEYGVSASPRVATNSYDTTEKPLTLVPIPQPVGAVQTGAVQAYALKAPATRLKRGGGRDQTGKPYVVRGKRFVPREDPTYDVTGLASWYGDAFHGRLTANGEVYDMNHLSAAHPTMPLPSYARVTSIDTGRSVVVRVNDRGPFAHGRVMDLSKRAGHVLGIKTAGVGKVRVQYLGRAPLHGQDDAFLLASYREGTTDLNADRVQIAKLNGSIAPVVSPTVLTASADLPGVAPVLAMNTVAAPMAVLPESGPDPISPTYSAAPVAQRTGLLGFRRPSSPLSYGATEDHADRRVKEAFDVALSTGNSADWKSEKPGMSIIALGDIEPEGADLILRHFGGSVRQEADGAVSGRVPTDKADKALTALWKAGVTDAFVLR